MKIVGCRWSVVVLIDFVLLFALSLRVYGQLPEHIPQIGFIAFGSAPSYAERVAAFRSGLQQRGYIVGKNIQVVYRYAEKDFGPIVADMIKRKVDIIVSGGTPPALAAKKASKTIPIVVAVSGDTVGAGLAASLAHPGGDVTGLTAIAPDLTSKRLEFVKDVLPKVSRVAVLSKASNAAYPSEIQEAQLAGQALGIELQIFDVEKPADFEEALQESHRKHAEAMILLPEGLFTSHRRQLVTLSQKYKLAAVFYDKEFVEAGGLMSYGVNYPDLFRRAATYVDKILKGAKPADLPSNSRLSLSWSSI
jgi:putative ABC transport system substrate-binding protein